MELRVMNENIKAFMRVAVSNFSVMILGIVTTLIIPILLGPEEFGLWQLFLLYSSYVGIAILGYNDGIYLIYGGKKYDRLPRGKFSAYFLILLIYLFLFSIVSLLLIFYAVESSDKQFILGATSIALFLQCLNSYFVLINQATARFNIYSIANVIEKLFFVILLLLAIFIHSIDFKFVIYVSLVSKLVVLLFNIVFGYKIIFTKPTFDIGILYDIRNFIGSGIFLTISGVTSMLMTGIGRFIVEGKLGVLQFGYYSFAFTVLTVVTQVIVAASVVMFPIMRNKEEESLFEISSVLDKTLEYMGVILNLLYYVVYIIILILLPKYTPSLSVIIYTFPILIFQSRISIIYNTVYKVLRLERRMLYNSLISVVFGLVVTVLLFNLVPTIEMVGLATLITYWFWYFLSSNYLRKYFENKIKISNVDIVGTVVFIILNTIASILPSIIIYLIFIITLFTIKRNDVRKIIINIRKMY